jgi:hypothetical protein
LREAELEWVRGIVKQMKAGELGSLSEWRSLHAERVQRNLGNGEE